MLSKPVPAQHRKTFTGFEEKNSAFCQQCGQSDVIRSLPVGTEGQIKWSHNIVVTLAVFGNTKTKATVVM